MDPQTVIEILKLATALVDATIGGNDAIETAALLEDMTAKALATYKAETGKDMDLSKLQIAPIDGV